MFRWQPGKWAQFAVVGVGLPYLASGWLSTNSLVADVSTRAAAAVGGDWAKINLEGRDATLTGEASSKEMADAAIKAVQNTYGVRVVNADGLKIVPPAPEPLAAPTIAEIKADAATAPEITGTWPEGKAKALDVTVNGKTYSLGKDPELTSSAGNWSLKLAAPLPSGSYDVTAVAGDGVALSTPAAQPQKIVIAEAAPPAPAPLVKPTLVPPAAGAIWPFPIIGTWPEGIAKSLSVGLAGITYELGKNPELTSDGKGTFTLQPPADLKPGTYDLDIKAADDKDQTISVNLPAAIVVPEPPAPPQPPPPAPTPVPLAAPTVDVPKIEAGQPIVLSGTWPVGAGNSFSVTVNGQPHKLGTDFDLLSDASGKWTLKPKEDLPPGHYDVAVQVTNGVGEMQEAKASFDIPEAPAKPAPAAPPSAPTIDSVTSDSDHPVVKGTWPVGGGNTLQVELDGVTHTLGKDTDLLSDTAGKWTLTPAKPVVNGTYDIVAKVTGADGQSAIDASKNELTVNVAPPPPAPAPEQPYDCEGTLAKIAAVFPIRFEFNHADLGPKYQQALTQYSALLGDKRCEALKLQVAGHADYIGPESYNQSLSERRAKTVADALVAAKIDTGRITTIGFGASKPLDPAHSNDARAKNRRVEFSISK